MFTAAQRIGIDAMLRRNWEEEKGQAGPPRPTIAARAVTQEPWGEGLSVEEAVSLIQYGLVMGDWLVGDAIPDRDQPRGYFYTDPASGPLVEGYYPAENVL